jgi:hypothetical protein
MRLRLLALFLAAVPGVAGCNSILGNEDHSLAPADSGVADAPQEGNAGGSVPPTSGGIYSVGRVPDDASAAMLPDGGLVTLTDDGFEFGETLCKGTTCVTGAIVP